MPVAKILKTLAALSIEPSDFILLKLVIWYEPISFFYRAGPGTHDVRRYDVIELLSPVSQ